jgi:hypothetical protein
VGKAVKTLEPFGTILALDGQNTAKNRIQTGPMSAGNKQTYVGDVALLLGSAAARDAVSFHH